MNINLSRMQIAAQDAEDFLKTVAHRHRLLILCQLVDGERSVGELADALDVRSSTMSQHLALLRKDELVSTRRDGQTIYYALSSGPAQILLEALARIYCPPPPRRGAKSVRVTRTRAGTKKKDKLS